MKTTKQRLLEDTNFRSKLESIITDCLITGEAEREAENVAYGNPDYYVDQIIFLIEELIGEGVPQVLTKDNLEYQNGWCDGRNLLRKDLKEKLRE